MLPSLRQVFVGALSLHYEALSVEASKQTKSEEIVSCIIERLKLKDPAASYELAEVVGDEHGQECKERRLGPAESPVQVMLLWPKINDGQEEYYRSVFYYTGCTRNAKAYRGYRVDSRCMKNSTGNTGGGLRP